jgi:hypothetical protein
MISVPVGRPRGFQKVSIQVANLVPLGATDKLWKNKKLAQDP